MMMVVVVMVVLVVVVVVAVGGAGPVAVAGGPEGAGAVGPPRVVRRTSGRQRTQVRKMDLTGHPGSCQCSHCMAN